MACTPSLTASRGHRAHLFFVERDQHGRLGASHALHDLEALVRVRSAAHVSSKNKFVGFPAGLTRPIS